MDRKRITRAAFAAMTAVALGFGARQAVAAPSAGGDAEARACTDQYCREVVCYPFPGTCEKPRGICRCAG